MSDVAIRVHNLGKRYRIGRAQRRHDTLRDALTASARAPLQWFPKNRNGTPGDEWIWALKDVSFEIQRGEVVGVIGRNGAGKSTLLKILSRITEPTEGYVEIHGRVGTLLEVGTGFHPELTGRENIYLSGAILGMRKAEIDRRFDEIVAFAEIEKFIDTPVKHYSSGMYVRLAFAVAAHLEPEILLVDEVLAVGDAAFQKKCLGKMGDVAKEGRTVVFVSHNMATVRRLCETGIYLVSGTLQSMGAIDSAINLYHLSNYQDATNNGRRLIVREGETKYTSWELVNSTTGLPHSCYSRDECQFKLNLSLRRTIRNARLGFELNNVNEQKVISAHSMDEGGPEIDMDAGNYQVIWRLRVPLKEGIYTVVAGLGAQVEGQLDLWVAEPPLTILPKADSHLPTERRGLVSEDFQLEINRIGTAN